MEQQIPQAPQSTLHKTFGIIALVLGILAFLFSFIPCLGSFAVFPGILGLILGVVAFIMAGKVSAPKGLIIAAVILSILGTAVAAWQYNRFGKAVKELDKVLKDSSRVNELQRSMDSSFKALDSANHQ